MVRECERRVAELESLLAQAQAQARMMGGAVGGASDAAAGADVASQPQPTMAAPGYAAA